MKKKYYLLSLVFLSILLSGCATNHTEEKNIETKKSLDQRFTYLDKHSSPVFKYSRRNVQFILTEGREEKIIIDLVIDGNTKVFYSNSKKHNIKQNLVGSKISTNNYSKNDYYSVELEIKNHWRNEYLVAKIIKEYLLPNGKVSKHYAANSFNLGTRGELVPKTLNLPVVKTD